MQAKLREGEEVYCRITNYKKNGEKFQNLLSMKQVRSNDNSINI